MKSDPHNAFDAAAILPLLPPAELPVPGATGLCLRRRRDPSPLVARSKRAAWTFRFQFLGQRHCICLGYWPAMPPSEALRVWRSARDQLDLGQLPSRVLSRKVARTEVASTRKERKDHAADPTLRELLETHWAALDARPEPPKTRARTRQLMTAHLPEAWYGRRASTITTEDCEAWLLKLGTNTPASARILFERWRTIWLAKFNGAGPWRRTPALKPVLAVRKRKRILADAELAKFMRWLPGARLSPTIKDVLMLALYTGARSGELIGMTWNRVDLDGKHYALPAEATKTNETRNLMLPPGAVAILARRREEAAEGALWVFPSPMFADRPMRQSSLWNGLDREQKAAGFEKWTVHDLRRSMRTGLARLGCPFEVAEMVLGHALSGAAAHYAHYQHEGEQVEWLTRWQKHLAALAVDKVTPISAAKRLAKATA